MTRDEAYKIIDEKHSAFLLAFRSITEKLVPDEDGFVDISIAQCSEEDEYLLAAGLKILGQSLIEAALGDGRINKETAKKLDAIAMAALSEEGFEQMPHWTDEKEAPFKAWVLNNDYIPEEIEVVSKHYWSKMGCLMFALSDGDKVNEDSIFSSPASAIAVGWRALKEEKKDIDEITASYKKRRINLKVAEERFGVSK